MGQRSFYTYYCVWLSAATTTAAPALQHEVVNVLITIPRIAMRTLPHTKPESKFKSCFKIVAHLKFVFFNY